MIPSDSTFPTPAGTSLSDFSANLRFLHAHGLLEPLLADRTTNTRIVWATNAYADLGFGFLPRDPITPERILDTPGFILRPRAAKAFADRSSRTKSHAEVFTPLPVCRRMIDALELPGDAAALLDAACLEITCGEAPFLSTRYDPATGTSVPPPDRFGILDRKLRAAATLSAESGDFPSLALRACRSTYGYEFQGDNLLIARINLFMAIVEAFPSPPIDAVMRKIALVIAANLVQMDGLSGTVPYFPVSAHDGETALFGRDNFFPPLPPPPPPTPQQTLFAFDMDSEPAPSDPRPAAVWTDWKHNQSTRIPKSENQSKEHTMHFDYIIGNPPYQEETADTSDNPVYHTFMDAAYEIGRVVCLITPARFLFNAGKTPKVWNEKMLSDPHFKVLEYIQKSGAVFSNTDITGGVAITLHDVARHIGPIQMYSAFQELNTIFEKAVSQNLSFYSFSELIRAPESFHFTEAFHAANPHARALLSQGHDYDLTTNIFEKLPEVFTEKRPRNTHDYVQIFGRHDGQRAFRFVRRDWITVRETAWLDQFKILLPKSNGSGALGAVTSTPLIGEPLLGGPSIGWNQSFLGIGPFSTQAEAEACLKYIKTKFARAMLGILKITQDNKKSTWKYVPLQDFTPSSDIDWSEPVAGIDRQLYAKYGLTAEEIAFVETHVREME